MTLLTFDDKFLNIPAVVVLFSDRNCSSVLFLCFVHWSWATEHQRDKYILKMCLLWSNKNVYINKRSRQCYINLMESCICGMLFERGFWREALWYLGNRPVNTKNPTIQPEGWWWRGWWWCRWWCQTIYKYKCTMQY